MAPGYSPRHSAPQNRSQSPSPNAPPTTEPSTRPHFGAITHNGIMAANSRSGAGSPSHDMPGSSRLYSKRFVPSLLASPPRHGCWGILHPFCLNSSLTTVSWTEQERFRPRKAFPAYPSIHGAALPPAATRRRSARIFLNHPPMAFLTSPNCPHPTACPSLEEPEPVPCRLVSPPADPRAAS